MKNFILDNKSIIIVIALVFSFNVSSQTAPSGPNGLQETFHESYNVTGNNLVGSSGKVSYSIGQVFFTSIGQSVNKAYEGVQSNHVDQTIWDGTHWNNGAPTSLTDAFIIGDYNVPANITASNLTVGNNALTIIPSGFNVNLNEAMQVKSGSFTLKNNANLIQTSEGTNSGIINVERESSSLLRFDYTLWSSPVKNDTSFLQAFSPSTSTNRFYRYNTSTNLYNVISNALTIPFALGQSYLIQMPKDASPTIRTKYLGIFSGVPNNGIITITLANDGSGKRFNLVGNPYPSPIKMAQFITDNSTNIAPTLYFWRKTSGSAGGSYCTWAGGIFVSNNDPEAFDPNGIIQTGQGFFVEALASANTVVFNNGQRIANNANQFFKIKAVERNTIWLNATNTSGAFAQMAIGYTTNATTGVDLYDGKYFNDGDIALNSFLDNTDYVIQGRPLPFDGSDVVPLSFKATSAGNYTIAIDHVDGLFSNLQEIILKDNDNGIETNLKLGRYNFTAPAGATNSRFSLKFQKTLGVSLPDLDENSIIVYQNQGKINIISKISDIKNIKIYDVKGRLLFENTNINAKETSFDSLKFADQVLIARISLDDDKLISKKIINQNAVDKH